jgi:hypothetical protein
LLNANIAKKEGWESLILTWTPIDQEVAEGLSLPPAAAAAYGRKSVTKKRYKRPTTNMRHK